MAIARGNVQSAEQNTTGTSFALAKPTGLVDGDVLVAGVANSDNTVTPTPPAGWVQIGTNTIGSVRRVTLWYKVVTSAAGEGATYTWTVDNSRISGCITRYSGVNNATPIDVTASSATGSATSLAAPSITTVTAGAVLVVAFGVNGTASATTCTPAGTAAEFYEASGVGRELAVADETRASAGATGTRTYTQSGVANGVGIVMGALRPATATPNLGAATGAVAWVGTSAGARASRGASTGSVGWVSVASGKRAPKGTGSGSVAWVGSAAGTTVRRGAASGAVSWSGTASGTSTHRGSASGSVTWAGAANGARAARGAVAGAVTWVAVATGARASRATATGTVAWSGTASGTTSRHGSAAGAITWTGVTHGTANYRGQASGSVVWAGSAAGRAPTTTNNGAASGAVLWAGTAHGAAPYRGAATGTLTLNGTTHGTTRRAGSAASALTWVGVALGTAPGQTPTPVVLDGGAELDPNDAEATAPTTADADAPVLVLTATGDPAAGAATLPPTTAAHLTPNQAGASL